MATSVFKGVAAWDIFKKGLSVATTFVKGSVDAMVEAESQMDLVRGVITSMGKSYDEVIPKIQDFAKSMSDMGRDEEDVYLATVKLAKLVGGDLTQGMKLAKLASDLTASGYGDLSSNVDNLSKVIIGKGNRALLEYRINVSKNATVTEQMDAITKKVTRTTEQWAQTTQGKIATASEAWKNFQENVGQIFGPFLGTALSNWNTFLSTTDKNTMTWSQRMGQHLNDVLNPNAWAALSNRLQTFSTSVFAKIFKSLGDTSTASYFENQLKDLDTAFVSYGDSANYADAQLKNMTGTSGGLGSLPDATDDATAAIKKLQDALDKVQKEQDDVSDKYRIFIRELTDSKKAIEDESAAFIKAQQDKSATFEEKLAEMVSSHKKAWEDANKEIAEIQKEGVKPENINRLAELQATSAKEYAIVQPYLNRTDLTAISNKTDIDKLVEENKRIQAEDTIAQAKKLQDLQNTDSRKIEDFQYEIIRSATGVQKETLPITGKGITINFDLRDATLTDQSLIKKIQDAINKSLAITAKSK
jgi:hypothetical protein